MALDNHVRRGHPILFGLIVFFSIIAASTATWLTAKFNQHHNWNSVTERDRVRYLVFVGWWTVLFGSFYTGLFLHSATGSVLTSVASHLIFLGLTWLFWTAGAAAITEVLGGGNNCSNLAHNIVYCTQLNALEAFSWIVWIFVTIALVVVIVTGVFASRRGDGLRGHLVSV